MTTSSTSNALRKRWLAARRQRGQALPLGALGLMIMALAIIATLNLGQAVHEKIKLQNSADAAAYSLAAMEARAFNFISLTNRTQIVHYNTAMALQSYLTYAGYCMGLFGTLRDMVKDLALVAKVGCAIPPPVGPPYCALERAMNALASLYTGFFKFIQLAYKALHYMVYQTVEAMGLFNKAAIWQMQFIRALQINTHLITGMQDFVLANDPTMTYTAKNQMYTIFLNQVLNSLEFRSAFDRGAGLNPFWLDSIIFGARDLGRYKPNPSEPAVTDAMKIMTEISNGSRSHDNIYNRGGALGGYMLATLPPAIAGGEKHGNTRFIEDGAPEPKIKELHEGDPHYVVGDTLAADDYLQMGGGAAIGGIANLILLPWGTNKIGDGIIANKDGGKHYKYDHKGSGGAAPAGYTSVLGIPFPPAGQVKTSFTKKGDTDHKWPGLAPYFKFNPSSERNSDFNQPSTWVFLNKHHDAFQSGSGTGGRPWHYKFTWDNGGGSNSGQDKDGFGVGGGKYEGAVSLDTTIGGERNHFLLEGLNVISRGMVYYHRPGTWDEPPNMFNPFWRARLAPVGAKLMNVWDRFLGSKITSNSDSRITRMVVNVVRNFISDVMLRTVTAVMTH